MPSLPRVLIEEHTAPSEALLDVVCALEEQIFDEPYAREKLRRRMAFTHHFLGLIATVGGEPVGYKLGYEMTDRLYYSWVGGVVPQQRRLGIATRLMAAQHERARTWGYRCVRTHTENRCREMLILNLRAGFDIVGLCTGAGSARQQILLEKLL